MTRDTHRAPYGPAGRLLSAGVITRREVIASVPARFESQYGQSRSAKSWKCDVTRGEQIDALNALDPQTCSAEQVNAIIGNASWTDLRCDGCGSQREAVIRLGDEPDYDARWQDMCGECLSEAAAILRARLAADGSASLGEG